MPMFTQPPVGQAERFWKGVVAEDQTTTATESPGATRTLPAPTTTESLAPVDFAHTASTFLKAGDLKAESAGERNTRESARPSPSRSNRSPARSTGPCVISKGISLTLACDGSFWKPITILYCPR